VNSSTAGQDTGTGASSPKESTMKTIVHRTLTAFCLLASTACSGDDSTDEAGSLGSDANRPAETPGNGVADLSRDEQIGIIEQRLEATNIRDWDRWEALHTPDAVRTAPELEQELVGAAAMRAAIETLSVAFPDYHLELRQAFGQGPWLAVRLHTTGTMTGPLMLSDGALVPATGQGIDQDWAALVRFEGDHIAEFHEFYDQLTLMVQLGLVTP
jgi:ketosteroid isomerase-like protein